MSILLTGATGFIGNHILKHLPESEPVLCIVRPGAVSRLQISGRLPGLIPITGNFYDPALYSHSAFNQPIRTIIHAAAIRGAGQSTDQTYQQVNVSGTSLLLDFARRKSVEQFIYISTVGVLGTIPETVPAVPEMTCRPDNLYHRTKAEAEQLVRNAASAQMSSIILRPTITWGTGDNGFLPRLIRMVRSGIFIYPRQPVRLHLLQAQSLAGLIGALIRDQIRKSGTYMVADRENVLLDDLVGMISRYYRNKPYPAYHRLPSAVFKLATRLTALAGREGLQTSLQLISADWYYDISKTVNELYFKPVDTLSVLPEVFPEYAD